MDKEKLKPMLPFLLAAILFITFAVCSCLFVRSCKQIIDQAGGVRELVIQEGKAARSIYKDISDDNYTKP